MKRTLILLVLSFVITQSAFCGQISGTITQKSDSSPVEGVKVYINEYMTGNYKGYATTDMSGNYTTTDLPGGNYKLYFAYQGGYLPQYYDGQEYSSIATAVSVTDGVITPDINFEIVKEGIITGTVTDAETGMTLSNINIRIFSGTTGSNYTSVNTDANGNYTASRLAPGVYRLLFRATQGYLTQAYDSTDWQSADLVSVVEGQTVTDIDFALNKGGVVTGVVRDDSTGDRLANVWVAAYDYSTGEYVKETPSDPNGDYVIDSLVVGTYIFCVQGHQGYLVQYFDNAEDASGAMPVTVTLGSSTSGIDFSLIEGGKITGTVIDKAIRQPIENLYVYVYDFDTSDFKGYAITGADGKYTVQGLKDGTYKCQIYPSDDYLNQYYNNKTSSNANPIEVSIGSTVSGIDFEAVIGSTISGTVLDPDGLPVANIGVYVYDYYSDNYVSSVQTDSNGQYTVDKLAAGVYGVKVFTDGFNYIEQYYDHVSSDDLSSPVTVGETENVSGINFDLQEGVAISGRVTAPDGSGAVNVQVVAFVRHEWMTQARTDADGNYIIDGLLPNQNYRLAAYPQSGTYYAITPKDVSVGNESLTGVNIQLNPEGRSVSGTVTDKASGEPLVNVNVFSHIGNPAYEFYGGNTYTDPNGNYLLENLPSVCGVEVIVDNLEGYARAQQELCLTADISGVNFELETGVTISGFVIDIDTGEPVANIQIEAWNDQLETGTEDRTDQNGRFTLEGVMPGLTEIMAKSSVSSGYTWSMGWPCGYILVEEGIDIQDRYVSVRKGALATGRFVSPGGLPIVIASDFDFKCDWFNSWGNQTDSDGRFQVRIPVGTTGIDIKYEDTPYCGYQQSLTVNDLGDIDLGDIILYSESDGDQVSGTVTNPNSSPVMGEFVVLAAYSGKAINADNWSWFTPLSETVADGAGNFTLSSLSPVNHDIHLITYYSDDEAAESVTVQDSAWNISGGSAGVNLVYGSEGGTITGTIKDVNGQAIAGSQVLINGAVSGDFGGFAVVNSDGVFTMYNVPPGDYTLTAIHHMYQNLEMPITVTEGGAFDAGEITLDYAGIRQGSDLDGNGLVNVSDLMGFAESWLSNGKSDLNDDGVVGMDDFNVLGQMWMTQAIWRN